MIARYLPFLDGKYSVAPGLQPLKKVEQPYDKLVFQIDETYREYLNNKQSCRKEDIRKYYREENLHQDTARTVNEFIVKQLVLEYPEQFKICSEKDRNILFNYATGESLIWKEDWIKIEGNRYLCLFDALACQVQEDFAVCQVKGVTDWIAAIHVCSANHWAPAEKTGKPFNNIHAVVPGMEKVMPHHFKMLLSVINRGPFTRFAWGIATDNRLNHHPEPPNGADDILWKGRKIDEGCELYLRVEKQTLNGLPEVNAFFFTIRTYFYPVNSLNKAENAALMSALESMSPESLEYKGLTGKVDLLRGMIAR